MRASLSPKENVSIKSPRLSTRVMFYYLNAKREWHDIFDAGSGMAFDEYFRQLGEQFYFLYKLLQPLQSVSVEMIADLRTLRSNSLTECKFGSSADENYSMPVEIFCLILSKGI